MITLFGELGTNHPRVLDIISSSCMTGSATNLIYGLSYGYFFNLIPFVLIAGFGYLCSFLLGVFGVALIVVGFTSFLPLYLNIAIFYTMA